MSKLDLIIEKILVFLICSLPILLITGSFLPDFTLSLASLIFIYYIYKKKIFYILNNNFTKIFIIFWIFLIISSINSENFKTSIFTSFFYIRFLIFTLVVNYLFNNSQNATATFRKSGNEIQIFITGGVADYYVQVRIQGSRAS